MPARLPPFFAPLPGSVHFAPSVKETPPAPPRGLWRESEVCSSESLRRAFVEVCTTPHQLPQAANVALLSNAYEWSDTQVVDSVYCAASVSIHRMLHQAQLAAIFCRLFVRHVKQMKGARQHQLKVLSSLTSAAAAFFLDAQAPVDLHPFQVAETMRQNKALNFFFHLHRHSAFHRNPILQIQLHFLFASKDVTEYRSGVFETFLVPY